MASSMKLLVIDILGMSATLANLIGLVIVSLIFSVVVHVLFSETPGRRGASEMRPTVGGYQPRKTPPDINSVPPGPKTRPATPKPIVRCPLDRARSIGCIVTKQAAEIICTDCKYHVPEPPKCQTVYEGFSAKPQPPRRRCPSKGFGEPIQCSECDRHCKRPADD